MTLFLKANIPTMPTFWVDMWKLKVERIFAVVPSSHGHGFHTGSLATMFSMSSTCALFYGRMITERLFGIGAARSCA